MGIKIYRTKNWTKKSEKKSDIQIERTKNWTEKSDIRIDRTKKQTKKSDIKKDRTKDIRHLNRSEKNLIKKSGKNIGQKNRTFN